MTALARYNINELERSLIIKPYHLDKILTNEKVWEMRSSRTRIRGRIGLIASGTGLIFGEANLYDCGDAISMEEARAQQALHQVTDLTLLRKWCYPWKLKDVQSYEKPKPYTHRQGAVIWVRHK